MKRKIGVTTWIFGDIHLLDTVKMISKMGFHGVELYIDIDRIPAKETRTIFEDHGLEIFSITPGNVNLASCEPNQRMTAINYYKKLIDYGTELGQPIITCHEYIQHQADCDRSGTLLLLTEACGALSAHAQKSQIKIGFEPLNRYLCRFVLQSTDALALSLI
jgi:D-psicose/D-tagatose/L-ribulose 3-epimerase